MASITRYSLLNKIDNSKLILYVELINTTDSFTINSPALPINRKFDRYANYRVLKVLKGDYIDSLLTIDYKLTNDKYKPFLCQGPVDPRENEICVLFLEDDQILFVGLQGKIDIRSRNQGNYISGIMEIIRIASIESKTKKAKMLTKAYKSTNNELKIMAMESIVNNWDLRSKKYGPVLINVLNDTTKRKELRIRSARRLGDVRSRKAYKAICQNLYDNDKIVRKICAESLRNYDYKDVIEVLEEFIQSEEWENGRKGAEISIREIKSRRE